MFGGESPTAVLTDESATEVPGLFDELYATPKRLEDLGAPLRRFAEATGTDGDGMRQAFAFFLTAHGYAPHLVPECLRAFFAEIAAHTDVSAGQGDLMQAEALLARAERADAGGVIGLLDSAVRMLRRAVANFGIADSGRFNAVGLLCLALRWRYRLTGRGEDLSEGIDLLRASISEWPDDPRRGALHAELSVALRLRAERIGDRADRDEAVEQGRLAVGKAQDHQWVVADALAALGAALLTRAAWILSPDDVEEAVAVARQGIVVAAPDLNRLGYALERLSVALHTRFDTFGDVADLVESVEVARRCVEATEDASLDAVGRRSQLCFCLLDLAQTTGSTELLDEAIAQGRAGINALTAFHPRAGLLWVNLSDCYRTHYEVTRSVTAVEAAVHAAQEALAVTSAGHPDHPKALFALASALWWQFERMGDTVDLDAALDYARQALDATAYERLDYPKIAGLLGQLAAAAAGPASIDAFAEAVAAGRSAVAGIPDGHPDLPLYQSSLAAVLRRRADAIGQLSDLDESISLDRAAADQVPPGRPDRARLLCNLGNTLRLRFRVTGDNEDLRDSLHFFRTALNTGTALPSTRLQAASSLGRLAGETGQWAIAADGYATAIGLLPVVSAPTLLRTDQEFVLSRLPGLAADAAACFLRAGMPEQAVQRWDEGRGVLLAQALGMRSDLSRLADHHPEVGRRVGAAWGRALRNQEPRPSTDAASDLKELIQEVRGLPGWEGFLAPPTPVDLDMAARGGPVVVVNVSQFGSDAMIITAAGINTVPLPGLTPIAVQDQVISFLQASNGATADPDCEMQQTLSWLWNAIASPVLDRLGVSAVPDAGEPWPRLWWCVSGLLSFLPLHAAGHHHTRFDPEPQTVIDRAVSSYAPTITALIGARNKRTAAPSVGNAPDVLVVAQPQTPGQCSLPGVLTEVADLKTRLPGRITELTGAHATRETVLRALTSSHWAHFACHGTSDLANPSSSSLLLHDYQTSPLTVIDLMQLQLDQAELAFLSACETARPGAQLSDEAIHLTAACQLAGFRDVIGTLWPINDLAAVEFADAFYSALLNESTDVAAAAHAATRHTRETWIDQPSLWAAHVHVGT
ncbi:conserved hypothetical protein [Parafrankia sp. EAN1pec]|nr:conserved hypothetical protein [Frankia sp. EAN1pec]